MNPRRRSFAVLGVTIVALLAVVTGAQASSPAPTTSPAPTISITYDGLQGDLVGGTDDPAVNTAWNQPNGTNDGEFTITIKHARGLTLTNVDLHGFGAGIWDTVYNNGTWGLGVTDVRSTTLLNNADSTISVPLTRGRVAFQLHADDDNFSFTSGRPFTVTATFSDSSTAQASVQLP